MYRKLAPKSLVVSLVLRVVPAGEEGGVERHGGQ